MREAMRKRRMELFPNMKQAADAAGITQGYWSVIESKDEMPTLKVAGRMARALKMKPEEAFSELAPEEATANAKAAS